MFKHIIEFRVFMKKINIRISNIIRFVLLELFSFDPLAMVKDIESFKITTPFHSHTHTLSGTTYFVRNK